jgi:soluble P-type ATPase
MEAAMALYVIPGQDPLEIRHMVLDYNGTLAADGMLAPGVAERLRKLALPPHSLTLHVVTADTMGTVQRQLEGLPCELSILGPDRQDKAKLDFIQGLGGEQTVAIGNGQNDHLMLAAAALGIAVIGEEGASAQTILASRVVCRDILSALALLLKPKRLVATLRC